MKKIMLAGLLIGFFATVANAQVELKINPIGIIFNSPEIAAEVLLAEHFGLEGRIGLAWDDWDSDASDIVYNSTGFNLIALGKYYFNPDEICDKFYIGAYLKFGNHYISNDTNDNKDTNTRVALGPAIGYKWLAASGKVAFELGVGVDLAFVNKFSKGTTDDIINSIPSGDFSILGTLAIAYRFGVE